MKETSKVEAGQSWERREDGKRFVILGAAQEFGRYAYVAYVRLDGTVPDEADKRYLLTRFAPEERKFRLVQETQ